jgi:hypothetical protein
MNEVLRVAIVALLGAGLVLVAVRLGASAMRAAKRSGQSAGAVGWALLFLTSGRMPPPPPASQIELDLHSEKDRESSDPVRKPANKSLERTRDG